MSSNYRKKTSGWIAGVALVAAATVLSGCSDNGGDGEAVKDKPSAQGSGAADQDKGGTEGNGKETPQSGAGAHSTPEEAVATLVAAIIEGDKKQACLVMGTPATGSKPAKANTEAICESDSPEVKQMGDMLERFRTSFTPKESSGDPQVDVADVAETGGKAVVPADKITVDGQTLDKVILSHSTGLEDGQLDVKFDATEIDGPWYVTNMDFGVG
ncbi:hypothetical protein ABT121_06170 [Streptomyces sp. NPDC001928]|uniref:hypothetical protein n=1 Tax=Streptomyces sp. NPDC001928 TaxID=3154404 RepID=UPI00332AE97D